MSSETSHTILVLHDSASLRRQAASILDDAGFHVGAFPKAGDRVSAEFRSPDLVLVEAREALGPYMTRLKASYPDCVLLVCAPREDPSAVTLALESGARDWVSTPLTENELLSRVRLHLDRTARDSARPGYLQHGAIVLDKAAHRVWVNDQVLHVSPTEYRLLTVFVENPGVMLGRRELLRYAWRNSRNIGKRTVDVHVRRLRERLEPHGCAAMIQTVHGFGYRFSDGGVTILERQPQHAITGN